MDKSQAVALMLEKMNKETIAICLQSNMEDKKIKDLIDRNTPSLEFLMSELYDFILLNNIFTND
jgi:hypothetical protein